MNHSAFRDDIPGENGVTSVLTLLQTFKATNEGRYVCRAENAAGAVNLAEPYMLTINESNVLAEEPDCCRQ